MEYLIQIENFWNTVGGYILGINILLGFVLIFFEKRRPTSLWAWLLFMYFIPILGFIFYLFLGQDMRKNKKFHIKELEDAIHTMVLRQDETFQYKREISSNPKYHRYNDMIRMHLISSEALYTEDNEIEIYTDGNDKFEALYEDIKQAKDHIHLQYYIIRNDFLAQKIFALLCKKAEEGVEVRVLYDGMGCIRVSKKFFQPLINAGGKVAEFLPPFLPYINLRVNFRNHRKIAVIDGSTGYIGGFNIGKEYLGLSHRFGYWRDTHLRIQGSAVNSLQLRFLQDWHFIYNENFLHQERYFRQVDLHQKDGKIGAQIVSSGPDSKWQNIRNGYLKMVMEAEERIYIQTPYFVLDDSLLESLKIAALSGIDVRIIIPHMPDHMFVYWASLSYVGELLQAGAKCYTYDKGFIHSKMIIIDGLVSSVGTANMDIRSFKLNFEINAFIYDEKTTNQLEEAFILDLEDCSEITIEKYKKRPLKIKFKESISRLLSPIL